MSVARSLKNSIRPLSRYPKLNRLARLLEKNGDRVGGLGKQSEIDALRDAHRDFVESVSHELRTPLTSLRLSVQMLAELNQRGNLENLSPEKLSHLLRTADRQIDRLKTLMDVFLEASTMKAEYLDLRPEPADLNELVSNELDRLKADSRVGRLPVRVSSAGRARGRWDRGRVEQALRHLLNNAALYGKERPVEVHVSGNPHNASVSVSDHGIGIAPEDQSRIFGAFERAVPASHYNGLGLGLYVARQIALAHQGDLSVKSRLGEGSTFTMRLPLNATKSGIVAA